MIDRHLLQDRARQVLDGAQPGRPTADAAWLAIGWAGLDPDRGLAALEEALSYAWADGRVPRERSAEGPGLVAPPLWALAARRLHEGGADPDRLRALLPTIDAAHRFFGEHRDPEGWHCVAVFHPWESPIPESPGFDGALSRVRGRDDEQRRQTLALALDGEPFGLRPFAVYDPLTSALLARAERDLSDLCAALGQVNPGARARATAAERGLRHQLYDVVHGRFRFYDPGHFAGASPDVLSAYGPTMLPDAPGRDAMISGLRTRLWSTWPLATTAATDGAFSARTVGRGAIQVELSWLFGAVLGPDLAERSLALVARSGFRRAYDARNGEGLLDDPWPPAAAVCLDWLTSEGSAC